MRKFAYFLIVSLCLVGCSEEGNEMTRNDLAQQGSVEILTATVGETRSRTSLGDAGAVLWSETDVIALNNGEAGWARYTLTDGAGTASATFRPAGEAIPEAGTYIAYYPAKNVTSTGGGTFIVTFSAMQTYTEGSFAPDALPMMARSTSTAFQFKHVCGLLKLTLTNGDSDGTISISGVSVAANEPMSGTADVTMYSSGPETEWRNGSGGVNVAFGQPMQLAAGASKEVYVALSVGTYTDAKISVITADGKYRTFSAGAKGFAIERATSSFVNLSLKSGEFSESSLPVVDGVDFQYNLDEAIGSNYQSDVQHIVFQPNVASVPAGKYQISYDAGTGTATVQFAAPRAKLTSGNSMFVHMSSLVSVDLSGLDTGDVTDMRDMFRGCSALTSLNLSGFDTGRVTDMSYMFQDCTSLESLNLGGFKTDNLTSYDGIFTGVDDDFVLITVSGALKTKLGGVLDRFRYVTTVP